MSYANFVIPVLQTWNWRLRR